MTATRSFQIDQHRVPQMLEAIRRHAAAAGVRFVGTERSGSFSGVARGYEIEGSYTVSGDQLMVTLTKHPDGFFANANAVFGEIQKWIRA